MELSSTLGGSSPDSKIVFLVMTGGLGFQGRQGASQKLPLVHRMEERTGERRNILWPFAFFLSTPAWRGEEEKDTLKKLDQHTGIN